MEQLLEKIAFNKIDDKLEEEHRDFLVSLLLKEAYYYSLEEHKEIDVEDNLFSIHGLIVTFYNQLARKTDLWDGLYIIHSLKYGTENNYAKFHKKLYTELYAQERSMQEYENVLNLAMKKIATHIRGGGVS